MRWFIFLIFMFPTASVAEKMDPEEFFNYWSEYFFCTPVFEPWLEGDLNKITKFDAKHLQLVMEFEIDKNLFNQSSLMTISKKFFAFAKDDAFVKEQTEIYNSFTQQGKDYYQSKFRKIVENYDMKKLYEPLLDPYTTANKIRECVDFFNLKD